MEDPPCCELFTPEELSRHWAIEDVLKAYREELKWQEENSRAKKLFKLDDYSAPFITARMQHEFAEWCPVRHSL